MIEGTRIPVSLVGQYEHLVLPLSLGKHEAHWTCRVSTTNELVTRAYKLASHRTSRAFRASGGCCCVHAGNGRDELDELVLGSLAKRTGAGAELVDAWACT